MHSEDKLLVLAPFDIVTAQTDCWKCKQPTPHQPEQPDAAAMARGQAQRPHRSEAAVLGVLWPSGIGPSLAGDFRRLADCLHPVFQDEVQTVDRGR